MISVKITAGIYSCEISGEDFLEIREESEKFLAEFSEMPGFENNCKPSKSRKRANPVESAGKSGEICDSEMLLEWLQSQPSRYSRSWIEKRAPFPNADKVLRVMARNGEVRTAETPYERSNGHIGYMDAYYMVGDTLPEPWPATDPAIDDGILLNWLETNVAYRPTFVENNCGIPPRYAKKSLNRLIVAKTAHVRKGKDGKGRVYKGEK